MNRIRATRPLSRVRDIRTLCSGLWSTKSVIETQQDSAVLRFNKKLGIAALSPKLLSYTRTKREKKKTAVLLALRGKHVSQLVGVGTSAGKC